MRDWLILVPLPLKDGQSSAEGLDQEQLPGEANLRPHAGDKVQVGDAERTWRPHHLQNDYTIDFNALLGKIVNRSAAYAICYLQVSEERSGLKVLVGSDDQAKVYLNGKEIYRYGTIRSLGLDSDTVEDVTLHAGLNVLVFKVVNDTGEWKGCLRFVNRTGEPARGIQVKLTPQP